MMENYLPINFKFEGEASEDTIFKKNKNLI